MITRTNNEQNTEMAMSNYYLPTPWYVRKRRHGSRVLSASGIDPCLDSSVCWISNEPNVPDDKQGVNATLIVACVNAVCEAAGAADPVEFARQLPARLAEATEREAELIGALRLAEQAMERMGDILNEMDVVTDEDEEVTFPAFEAVRGVLSKYEAQTLKPYAPDTGTTTDGN